jgi:hypothetical protein
LQVDNIKKLLLDIQLVLRVALKDGLDGSGFDGVPQAGGMVNMAIPLGGHDSYGISSDPAAGACALLHTSL